VKTAFFYLLVFSFSAFAKPVNTGFFNSTALKGYDTVAYFTLGKAVKGSKKLTYKWNGVDWKFSSQKNLELFKTSPEKYAPQYGGYCAYAMADGKKVAINPKAFDVKDGKLYLNYNKSIQKKWKNSVDNFIKDADSEWNKID